MPYSIRPISPSDSDEWLRLRNLLWDGDDHQAEISQFFRGELDEPVDVLLAINDNKNVVGHVELSIREDVPSLEGLRTGYIEGLYVVAEHRATGVAVQLLRASEQWAREQGCQAFASDREDRIIVHTRFPKPGLTGRSSGAPPAPAELQRWACESVSRTPGSIGLRALPARSFSTPISASAMRSNLTPLLRSSAFLVVVCSLFGFGTNTYQSVLAHRVAAEVSATYEPAAEQQALAVIMDALPSTAAGSKAAFLAKGLGTAAESQYDAQIRAANHFASHTLHQALGWAAVSMLAVIALFERHRKRESAA